MTDGNESRVHSNAFIKDSKKSNRQSTQTVRRVPNMAKK